MASTALGLMFLKPSSGPQTKHPLTTSPSPSRATLSPTHHTPAHLAASFIQNLWLLKLRDHLTWCVLI